MSLEQAVKHFMSDGIVELPQAPEGSYEFDSAPGADSLRGTLDGSFDRMDAAAAVSNPSQNIIYTSPDSPTINSPSPESGSSADSVLPNGSSD